MPEEPQIDQRNEPAVEDSLDRDRDHEPIAFREISLAIEFLCWVVVTLCPMLRLANGPPVTDDQAVIQISLVVLAICGAVGLRVYNLLVKPPDGTR